MNRARADNFIPLMLMLLALLWPAGARGDDRPQRPQVAAATAQAGAEIPDRVERVAVTPPATARADAIGRVIDSIKPIELSRGKTVGDALANADVRAALNDWLDARPVTRVDYRRDMQVELFLAGTLGGCSDVVRRAVTKYTE